MRYFLLSFFLEKKENLVQTNKNNNKNFAECEAKV